MVKDQEDDLNIHRDGRGAYKDSAFESGVKSTKMESFAIEIIGATVHCLTLDSIIREPGEVDISGPTTCLTFVALNYQVSTREDASFVPQGSSHHASCVADPEIPQAADSSILYPIGTLGSPRSYQLTDTSSPGVPAPTFILAGTSTRIH